MRLIRNAVKANATMYREKAKESGPGVAVGVPDASWEAENGRGVGIAGEATTGTAFPAFRDSPISERRRSMCNERPCGMEKEERRFAFSKS